ncbi:MAG: hypothetical protein M3N50_08060 [Pseudomonadota bacterium]|nr:hypothetical protein [Pseudomonadota bacterium]
MNISDETLMAYADGELDASARAAVEAAMRANPQIERRIAQHRALRERICAAYAAELSNPVPEELLATMEAASHGRSGNVLNLAAARRQDTRKSARTPARSPWLPLASMAASVLVGVAVGYFMSQQTQAPLMRIADGRFVARGQLANVLSNQVVADQRAGSAIMIGVSFVAKSGDYCRTFALSGTVSASGLACRHGPQWLIQALDQGPRAVGDQTEYRTASSPMTALILKSVEDQIVGEALDQASEEAARNSGWTAAKR